MYFSKGAKYTTACVVSLSLGASLWLIWNVDPRNSTSLKDVLSSLRLPPPPNFGQPPPPPFCPPSCPSSDHDPFSLPGFIHWGENRTETRWIPFLPPAQEQAPLKIADMDFALTLIPDSDEVRAAPPYLQTLAKGETGGLEFARDKLVLLIDDRNNVEQFCGEVPNSKYSSWGGHVGGACHVHNLNLTIVNLFTLGMVDSKEDFEQCFKGEQGPGPFEERWDGLFEPLLATREGIVLKEFNPDGSVKEGHEGGRAVDLVVYASLFWDDHFLSWHRTRLAPEDRPSASQLGYTYPELTWHRSRLRTFVHHLKSTFGPTVPLMLRTRQLRKKDDHEGLLKIFQLDQSARSVAREEGVRDFSWGEKLEGYGHFYDGDQHYSLGPSTYIFADMMFFYLHRAVVPGCWECHPMD